MTRLGQMIYDQGVKDGMEKAEKLVRENTTERINHLTVLLVKDSRIDDLKKAAEDIEYQEKLMQEYHL